MSERRAFYFGCLGEIGHYMHMDPHRPWQKRIEVRAEDAESFPWGMRLVDSGLLENGKVPDQHTGRVKWVLGGTPNLWHAFVWWDRSVDTRPACNSGFYVDGFGIDEREAAFAFACATWPQVVARQPLPLVLEPR